MPSSSSLVGSGQSRRTRRAVCAIHEHGSVRGAPGDRRPYSSEKAAGVSTDATRGRRASAHARVGWSGWDRVSSEFCGRSLLGAVRYRRATRPRRCRWQSRRGDFRDLRAETQRSCGSWTMRRLAVGFHGGVDGRLVMILGDGSFVVSPALCREIAPAAPAGALVQISVRRRRDQSQSNPTSRQALYCR